MNKNTVQLIDEAWESMVDFLMENEHGAEYKGVDEELHNRWYNGKLNATEVSQNLRCDWEIIEAVHTPEKVRNFVLANMHYDLVDLIENGEQSKDNDALLKTLDGVRVLGKDPVDFQIIFAALYREYRPNKKSYEYTLYLRPYVKWE